MNTETTERPILAEKVNTWCSTCGRGYTIWITVGTPQGPWECTVCRKWWDDNPLPQDAS